LPAAVFLLVTAAGIGRWDERPVVAGPGEVCVLKTLSLLRQVLVIAAAALLVSACNDQGSTTSSQSSSASSSVSTVSTTATLSWEAPTANTNGSALTNLAGYKIYYGGSPSKMTDSVQIKSVGVQTYVIDNLSAGTWYFAIMAVTSAGTESALSNVVSLTIG
jgi:hypothetical protein